MTEIRMTAAEIEWMLGSGTCYDSMSLKFTVDDREFEIDCAPGDLKFTAEREHESINLRDPLVPSGLFASMQLVVKIELRPYNQGSKPIVMVRQA